MENGDYIDYLGLVTSTAFVAWRRLLAQYHSSDLLLSKLTQRKLVKDQTPQNRYRRTVASDSDSSFPMSCGWTLPNNRWNVISVNDRSKQMQTSDPCKRKDRGTSVSRDQTLLCIAMARNPSPWKWDLTNVRSTSCQDSIKDPVVRNELERLLPSR